MTSASKFKDEVLETLKKKVFNALESKKKAMCSEDDEYNDTFEKGFESLYFEQLEDFNEAIAIANKLGLAFMMDAAELELLIDEKNDNDDIEEFYRRLEDIGLDYEDDEDNDLDENTILKKVSPDQKRKNKLFYKKNKVSLRLKAKKFRKSIAGKKLKKRAKRMKKLNKTSTGSRITRKS